MDDISRTCDTEQDVRRHALFQVELRPEPECHLRRDTSEQEDVIRRHFFPDDVEGQDARRLDHPGRRLERMFLHGPGDELLHDILKGDKAG